MEGRSDDLGKEGRKEGRKDRRKGREGEIVWE